jgi:hypothetical protein
MIVPLKLTCLLTSAKTKNLIPHHNRCWTLIFAWLAFICSGTSLYGETGADAWLRYDAVRTLAPGLPHLIAIVGNRAVVRTVAYELSRALGHGNTSAGVAAGIPSKDAFVLGRWSDVHARFPELRASRAPVERWLLAEDCLMETG